MAHTFTLSAPVAFVPSATQVTIQGAQLDTQLGILSWWITNGTPGPQSAMKQYSVQLTGAQMTAVKNLMKAAMNADLGVTVTEVP